MNPSEIAQSIEYIQHLQQQQFQQHQMVQRQQQQQQAAMTESCQIFGMFNSLEPCTAPTPQDLMSLTTPQQRKPSLLSSSSKKIAKIKPKKRVGSVPANSAALPPSSSASYIYSQQYQLQQQQQQQQLQQPQQRNPLQSQYHGPAPCGNPIPLYEYLASPTIVPGLEIIGHDFYGNYVQILPICPETTCAMNQDPVYLNLLQAIYAHTIPFLDLEPGSDEAIQTLLNQGAPSAITTQSIQPPFKNLLPYSGPEEGSASNSLTAARRHSTPAISRMTSSVSSPAFQQSFYTNELGVRAAGEGGKGSSRLNRRASMATIGQEYNSPLGVPTTVRRSSTTVLPSSTSMSLLSNGNTSNNNNNPAKKKKNTIRTHPYKSTSSFKEDNFMVTEAILNEVGGIGGIGNCGSVSATDPRRTKVSEKMVHMSEAEYASHYSRHQSSMNKSSLLLNDSALTATTRALDLMGQDQRHSHQYPQQFMNSFMTSSVSAPSFALAMGTMEVGTSGHGESSQLSSLESTGAVDFIRALSQNGATGLDFVGGTSPGKRSVSRPPGVITSAPAENLDSFPDQGLQRLENLMLMDDAAAAAIHAAAVASTTPVGTATSSVWPNWFDLHQLEKDVCEVGGQLARSTVFSSASCSLSSKLPLSSSTALASFADEDQENVGSGAGRAHSVTRLLLSSSTNLAMMMLDDDEDGENSRADFQGSHGKSTSQVLVFDPSSISSSRGQPHQDLFPNESNLSLPLQHSSWSSSSARLSTCNSSFNSLSSPSSSTLHSSSRTSLSEDTAMDESSDHGSDHNRHRRSDSSTHLHPPPHSHARIQQQSEDRVTKKEEYHNEDHPHRHDHDHHPHEAMDSGATAAALPLNDDPFRTSVSNDLSVPYTSSLLTVLPFSAQHSHPIFPTRGQNRRQGWYRSKSVASQALTEITGVDYTTTCWYDVEQLQSVVRESISLQELTALKSLEDLTEPSPHRDS